MENTHIMGITKTFSQNSQRDHSLNLLFVLSKAPKTMSKPTSTIVPSELQCDDCSQVFKTRPALRHHKWNLHRNGTVNFKGATVAFSRDPESDGDISCIVEGCLSYFRKQTHLQRHLYEVHTEKKGNLPGAGKDASSPLAQFGMGPDASSDDGPTTDANGMETASFLSTTINSGCIVKGYLLLVRW